MEVVGEVFLSALLEPLLRKLTSGDLLNFVRKTQVEKELNKWRRRLSEIDAVLKDADEKQITSSTVKIWLTKLRDLAYDVEDVLDEFQTEALASKVRAESQASSSTVRKLLPTCCAGLNPSAIELNMRTGSRLRDITTRLEAIAKEKNELDVGIMAEQRPKGVKKRVTTSLVKESHVCGRDDDKKAILELLMNDDASNLEYSVIPIIGMGGIGKTTLAQFVYNDESVKFDCKAWVCVSDDFYIPRITKTILQHSGSCEHKDLNVLQETLKDKLSGKKFLIVLDDVWSNNYDDWTALFLPFSAGARGSKVIITTRIEDIASKMGSVRAYTLERLSFDECLRIFTQHALDSENFDAHLELKEIGEEIVGKCKGLPLVAKTLGGLLRHKQNLEEWEDILSSEMLNLSETESDILSALRLSYSHLPSHLKQCFAYCAIFPKDYEFEEGELVSLWMAEGFLNQKRKKKHMEDLGHEYFRDLSSRSLFQQSSSNKSRFIMHDLISDLARFVSGEICFYLDDTKKEPCSVESYAAVRHSSFTSHRHDISQRFDVFNEMKNLRTFLALPPYLLPCHHLSSKVLDDLVPKLKCLRALSLAGYCVEELPNSIGTLKLLRYLNLSYTWIKRLPESLGELFNLQTLRLRGCQKLVELPTCVVNLINLQCLDIRDTDGLLEMPPQISNLINLRMLPKFIVGEGKGLGITELMKLSHLQGQLKIEGLQKVNVRDAELANLKEKTGLCDLALHWISNFDDPLRNERNELHVLDSLKPHRSLEELSVTSYGGTEFPSWIGDSCYSKLVHLKLLTCRKITSLSSVGKLPALSHLRIEGMDGVKEVYAEDFQSLETLYIDDMLGWERWLWSDGVNESTLGKFPKLSELTLKYCPRLIGDLPSCLPSLKKLRIERCQGVILAFRAAPDLTSLASLQLIQISGLVSLHDELVQALVALEDLDLEWCDELTYLWQDGVDLDKLSSLKRLRILGCEQLLSLVEGEEGILPCNLEVLSVQNCSNLEKLADGLSSLTSLRDLTIRCCRKLECFSEGAGLPLSLKRLQISHCGSLRSLPDGMMTVVNDSLLEKLVVTACPSLKWLPKGKLPKTLKDLNISWSLPEGILQRDARETSCSNLEHLTLQDLSATTFPTGEFPISLKELDIFNCRIPLLPPLHFLFHLTTLRICRCNELKSFPKGGLPPNLTFLEIRSCKITLPVSEWGLRMLTSLKRFAVESTIDVDRFPDDEGLLLPTLLTCLEISNLENLKSISSGLQHLTSLEDLYIFECPKLRVFPREGLPLSLGYLRIRSSPLLKERCLKERGDYWPVIAHIPEVNISQAMD
ncbi:putative disease resistance RPP13-like protein 1 isoform X2 [Populus alba]|uniref:putative disease resistance RPP13-like protein 1 isoform X2 n=1 Tax=Populus alba TaxID=43335 RepID=UPI00158835D6|nr:putative disease resistance RPP13-like protein 1 [Populus alba]XP_034901449.1 putative disease resistance RPP13-like protein 1 [Populus alba]